MRQLKQLLYSDLARQYVLEGALNRKPNFVGFLRRLLHHRFLPIVLFRISRSAKINRIPGLPEFLTYLNLVLFGLEISPRCDIGPGIYFPHTCGTVIGAWRIGANVTIFQGVTLGAKSLDMCFDPQLRPEVGDNAALGAGSKILGGIRIGDGAVVGANAVVLESVEEDTAVAGSPAKKIFTVCPR